MPDPQDTGRRPDAAAYQAGTPAGGRTDAGDEGRFRDLADAMPFMAWTADAEGTVDFVNAWLMDYAGLHAAERLGEAWLRALHPDDLDRCLRAWERSVRSGDPYAIRYRVRRQRDGEYRWHQVSAVCRRDAQGRIVGWYGTGADVDDVIRLEQEARHHARELAAMLEAQRVSDERFRLLAKATNDALWDWNVGENTLWWSDGFEVLFGFSRDEVEPTLDSWTTRIHPEDRDTVLASLHAAIDRGDDTWFAEYRFLRKDGTYATVRDRGGIIRDAARTAIRMVGGMTDITERKALEARLRRAQRLESIGTLAGGIAHDLNNLFTPILLGSQLLRETTHEADGRDVLASIIQSATRGAGLVRQVLSFARGVEGQRVRVPIDQIVGEVEALVARSFPKDIVFRSAVPDDLVSALGDPTQLHQVILNLCVNARDAMPDGGVLSIAAERVIVDERLAALSGAQAAGHYVLVRVADTGTGISADMLDHIFDPFFTTKDQGKGTGLGLSTVLGIVRSHGGFIDVESQVGDGTTFKVYLPAAAEDAAEWSAGADDDFRPGNGELILVVDDEQAVLGVARRTLEAFGYRVLGAGGGSEALDLFTEHRSDVAAVLTDMMMPGMSGRALIAALRERAPELPIVAASGLHVPDATGDGVEAVRFLPKPYTAEMLLAAVHGALHGG